MEPIMMLLLALSLTLNLLCIIALVVLNNRYEFLIKGVTAGFNGVAEGFKYAQVDNESLAKVMESVCTLQDITREHMTHYIDHLKSEHDLVPPGLEKHIH